MEKTTRETIERILAAAGNPNYAIFVSPPDENGERKIESVGQKDISTYADNITDEQYKCLARNVIKAMQSA